MDGKGEKHGPVPDEALVGFRNSGAVTDKTYVWTAGMANWLLYEQTDLNKKTTATTTTMMMMLRVMVTAGRKKKQARKRSFT